MSLRALLARAREDNVLVSVMVELTYRCNLDCFFCYNDLNLKGSQLGAEHYRRFFNDLVDLRTLYITFTGGEPLAHPEFFEIGGTARDLGFVIRIKSNGHALQGKLARRLKREVDPYNIDISLHGGCAATHDRQTRVAGSFERLLANLRELLDLGFRLQLNSTLTRWNAEEIEAMFDIADGLGIRLNVSTTVSPRDDGDRMPLTIEATLVQKRRVLRLLAERQKQRQPTHDLKPNASPEGVPHCTSHCGAGTYNVTIDPYGNVLPCVEWRRPLGNLRTTSIKSIWSGSSALQRVRGLNGRAKEMVDQYGDRGRLMTFCPGMAEQMTGNPVKVYNSARDQLNVLSELENRAK